MEKDRWERIEQLYHSALEQPAELRPGFLEQACAGDSDLLREVQGLIAHDGNSHAILDRPAWEGASDMLNRPELAKGTHLGPYRIEALLGSGGMGSVYRAQDTRLGRMVAIKILRGYAESPALRLRLQREAQVISSLNHPRICSLYDIGTLGDTNYLVMECVEGKTIAEMVQSGPLPIDTAVQIGAEIAEGLAAAHAKEIVHRDLKPTNVMTTETGVKILDFGISKTFADSRSEDAATLTAEGVVMGTPAYMSPEQFRAQPVDARSDIFSLGVVLYELVTGTRAFGRGTAPQVMNAILGEMPVSPRSINSKVPPELERLITKCLQKLPERRYQSAREVERELKQFTSPPRTFAQPFSRRRLLLAASCVGAAILAGFLWHFLPISSSGKIESLAVLPLDNLSGDPTQDYFADAMTEVLVTDLGKIGSLRVLSRASVMKFKGSRRPLGEVARELKVDALIVGSVARAEGKVRITTQLYAASKDRQLWAENYERDMRDVIALQREVAHAITSEIRVKVTPQEIARLKKTRPVNPEAYDSYLRGVLLYGRHSYADNEAAIATLDHALALDPQFAAGLALLAAACVERYFTFAPEEQKRLEEKAYVAVEKAISLDADESMAWFARGRLLWTPSNHFPHGRAIREYRHALALNPNSSEARAQLALTYNHVGLFDEALREARAAAEINPADALPRVVLGQALLYSGQYERALQVWSSNPPEAYASVTGSHLAWTLFQMGRTQEAAGKVEEFLAKYPRDVGVLGVRAVLLAASGHKAEAEAVIRSIAGQKGFGHFHHTAYYIACAYARMGDSDAALDWIHEANESGFACFPLFDRDPNLSAVRNHPRWGAAMSEYRQAWETYRKIATETI